MHLFSATDKDGSKEGVLIETLEIEFQLEDPQLQLGVLELQSERQADPLHHLR